MSKISVTEYAQALRLALQESGQQDHDAVVENFVRLLRENADLEKYEAVVAEYEALAADSQEIKNVEAVFARQSTANKGLLDELNAILGPKLEVRSRVDSDLVGGMVLRVDDTLIDASVNGNLDRLRNELSSS